jgi:hypothetical protein
MKVKVKKHCHMIEADVGDASAPSEPPNDDRNQDEDEEDDSNFTYNAQHEQPNVDRN